MKKEEKRIKKALINLKDVMDLDIWKDPLQKNLAESNKARKRGNELYVAHKHDLKSHVEILRQYSKSIAFAIEGSEELALGYGNRSALLAHLCRYRESIDDLDRALKLSSSDLHVMKYLVRKVECQIELGLEESIGTCELAKTLLEEMNASVEWKTNIVNKLAKAMIKLERIDKVTSSKLKNKLPNEDICNKHRSVECPDASSALQISRDSKKFWLGRHITATRDIQPGQVLYRSEHYVVFPMEAHVHTNCSHCLNFTWAGLPCPGCVYATYCSERCRYEAWNRYHDVECKIVFKLWRWSEKNNAGRLMSVRLLVKAVREAGSLKKLREEFEEIDQCKDLKKKGFSENHTIFTNNYKAVYSLSHNISKRNPEELEFISEDSALLLYLLARDTEFFIKSFGCDKRALARNDDALFVAKTLSRYQHLILTNAMTVKDAYSTQVRDWSWVAPVEESCTGLCLTPFLCLLNHSCAPNVTKIETNNGLTILFAIQPIAKDEQIYDCYGPTYAELEIQRRKKLLLEKFHFSCACVACEFKWPLYLHSTKKGLEFVQQTMSVIKATKDAHIKSDKIFKTLNDGNFVSHVDVIHELAYAITLTVKYTKLPNWRLSFLITLLITVLNEMYGYLINIPERC